MQFLNSYLLNIYIRLHLSGQIGHSMVVRLGLLDLPSLPLPHYVSHIMFVKLYLPDFVCQTSSVRLIIHVRIDLTDYECEIKSADICFRWFSP